MEKVFVTGATGYLGSAVVLKLIHKYGEENVIFYGRRHMLVYGSARNAFGDICDKDKLRNAMRGCSTVLHMAARVSFNEADKEELFRVNVKGTQNVVEVAQELGVKRIVFISAAATRISPYIREVSEETKADYPNECSYVSTKIWGEGIIEHSKIPIKVILYPTNMRTDLYRDAVRGRKRVFCPPGLTNVASPAVVGNCIVKSLSFAQGANVVLAGETKSYRQALLEAAFDLGSCVKVVELPEWTRPLAVHVARFLGSRFVTPHTVNQSYSRHYFNKSKAREYFHEWYGVEK